MGIISFLSFIYGLSYDLFATSLIELSRKKRAKDHSVKIKQWKLKKLKVNNHNDIILYRNFFKEIN